MSATKEFKVGDTVKMSDIGKKQYQDAKYNPYDLTGVITKIDRIIVKWSNGETNSYDSKHIELVEPKQEQYYTSKPTNIKVGDMFEVYFEVGICRTNLLSQSHFCKKGDIVSLGHNDATVCPRFELPCGKSGYLDWGWLKPVKDTEYEVGDWVLLINSNFNSHVSDMNKFKGTIQQIGSTNKYGKDIFYLKDDDKMWAFVSSDFVKKVDAPVATAHLADIPPKTLIGRTTTSTDIQQFSLGDRVKLLNVPVGSSNKHLVGQEGFVMDTRHYGFHVQFVSQTYWCKPEQLQLLTLEKTGMFSIGDEVELIDRASGYKVFAEVGSIGKILSIEGEQIKVAFKSSNQSCKACQIKLINNKTTNNNAKSNSTTSNDLRTAFSPDIRSKEIYSGQVFSEFNLPQIWSGH